MKDRSNMADGWSLALIERAKVYVTGRAFGSLSVCMYVYLTISSIVMISRINCDHP